MAALVHPNLPLSYGWALGDPYKPEMDANLIMLGSIIGLTVLSRTLDAPPVSPLDGDRYIVGSAPTGAWAGNAFKVALWLSGAWIFHTPKTGWLAWVQAESKLSVYNAGTWSVGIAI